MLNACIWIIPISTFPFDYSLPNSSSTIPLSLTLSCSPLFCYSIWFGRFLEAVLFSQVLCTIYFLPLCVRAKLLPWNGIQKQFDKWNLSSKENSQHFIKISHILWWHIFSRLWKYSFLSIFLLFPIYTQIICKA